MEIVQDEDQLRRYISEAVVASGDSPVLLDSFLADAIEVDVDALSDGKDVHIAGVMQHIEEAGVHSGDSACSLPPHSLESSIVARTDGPVGKTGARAEGRRTHECPVRGQGQRHLYPRGQSQGIEDSAIRGQGRQFTHRGDCSPVAGRGRTVQNG